MNPTVEPASSLALHIGPRRLPGTLQTLPDALGTVVFAHGSGSSRDSPRTRFVADVLHRHRLQTLRFDLLAADEAADRRLVFDIPLLAERLGQAIDALQGRPEAAARPIGLFGASTGAAAALVAAARRTSDVSAVVSRGGRGDLALPVLPAVRAPTLLIVGGDDAEVLQLNCEVLQALTCTRRLDVVPGATHLFEEPGALQAVADAAADWFACHLGAGGSR